MNIQDLYQFLLIIGLENAENYENLKKYPENAILEPEK